MPTTRAAATGLLLLAACGCGAATNTVRIAAEGDSRTLRTRPEGAPQRSPHRPSILLVAIDGVERPLLYDMLRRGEMPGMADLLGGSRGPYAHAHFDETISAALPSSTMTGWATALTGVGPGQHGMTGNEFFLRDKRVFAAPIPTTFEDSAPTLACFTTDQYCNRLLQAPTVYQRMRARDPHVLVWVAMHHIYAGADKLLLAERTAFASAFEGVMASAVKKMAQGKDSRAVYAKLDKEVARVVNDELDDREGPVPDVLTVYFSGTDLYGHIAHEGPDRARRAYLREVLDPEIGQLARHLRARGALANRWVVVTADHGHQEVLDDEAHMLGVEGEGDPPRVLEHAGFRVRKFALDVDEDADFQSVLAYQGAMAFVYVADRSTCPAPKRPCVWSRPPRYQEDVLPVAEAFHAATTTGEHAPRLRGKIDLVLTRRPRPYAEDDAPLEVYVGGGRTLPVASWLADNPRPDYVQLEERLRDLATGRHGERAGDVVLVAVNGDRDTREERFAFSAPKYRSWHGSPGKKDSNIPLIVSNAAEPAARIRARVARILGESPRQQKISDVLLALRFPEDGL